MTGSIAWRALLYRWRRWLIALALLVGLRLLLPPVLRRVIASQASKALHATVQVGDVDLSLFRGAVGLRDVAVRASDAPPDAPPMIGWKFFGVDLRWLPLFHKTVQFEEVVLDTPYVSLQRLKDGAVNLLALVPNGGGQPPVAPTPAPTPAAGPPPPGWAFGVDRIELRAGSLHFQDFMIADSEPVEVDLPTVEVTDIAVHPGLYGQPAHARIELKVDEGVLKIDTQASMREDGIGVETQITGQRLPLRRSRLYIPKVGWSDLRGTLSLELTHRFDTTGSRHDVRGTVGLQDVAVRVPGFEERALVWHDLSVTVDPIDLVEQRVVVSALTLDGLVLPMRPRGPDPLPLLHALMADSAAAPKPAPDTSAPPAPPAKPWHWSLAAFQLTGAKVEVLHEAGELAVGVGAEVHDLAGEGEQPAAVKLGLSIGEGSLNVDGKLRLAPLGFGGHVVVDKLNLPELAIASGAVPNDLIKNAHLALDLTVDTGSLAATPGDLNLHGTLSLTDAQAAPNGLGVALRSFDVGIDELQLAGLLAEQPGPNRGDLRLRGKLSITEPRVTGAGGQQPTASLKSVELTLDELTASALLPKGGADGQGAARGDIHMHGKLSLADAQIAADNLELAVHALDVGVDELQVAGLLSDQPGPNGGDVRVRGTLSIREPRVTAPGAKEPMASVKSIDLTLDDVSAPALLAKAGADGQRPPPGDLHVRGKLNVAEPRVVAANAKEFAVGAESIDVGFDDVVVPSPQNARPGPLRVRLGDVRIDAPTVRVTRTQAGIVLPQLTSATASPSSPPKATPPPAPAAGTAAPAAQPATAPPAVDFALASFQLSKGRIAFTDRTVKPFYSGLIAPLDIELKDVRFPNLSAQSVRVAATLEPQGTINATGSLTPSGSTLTLKIADLALAPFNPFATAYSPYGITDGRLSVDTKASFAPNGYKANSAIVLHDLDVSGAQGDSLFQEHFGIPLSVALALLRDMSGNITLDVPVEADQDGMKIGIGTIVAGALRSALVGALASPLKLMGALVQGGKVKAVAPPQIVFRPGRAELAPESEEPIKQLAAFVASRPGMGVTLEPVPSTRDIRWLREHALLDELGQPQGFFGALKNVGQGGKRERISKALAARAHDEAGELSAEDAQTLEEWLDQRPAPTAEQLHAVADARLAKIESTLRDEHGIDASRITRQEATAAPTDEAPAVRLQIGGVAAK